MFSIDGILIHVWRRTIIHVTPSCHSTCALAGQSLSVYQALRPWLSRVELSRLRRGAVDVEPVSRSCIEPVRSASGLAPERVLSAEVRE